METIGKMAASIRQLAKVSEIHSTSEVPSGCVSFFLPGIEAHVKVGELIDVESEIFRIMKKLKSTEKDIQKLEKKLTNENFLKKAPKEVVEKNRAELEELKEVFDKLSGTLQQLKNME
jgi:valyl-tRNA synthetase